MNFLNLLDDSGLFRGLCVQMGYHACDTEGRFKIVQSEQNFKATVIFEWQKVERIWELVYVCINHTNFVIKIVGSRFLYTSYIL